MALPVCALGFRPARAAEPDATGSGGVRSIRLDGAQVAYREWGTAGSPALFLLHPAPFNSAIWQTLAPVLARRYRVIAPDARGFGDSDRPPEYSNDVYLADLGALLGALGVDRVTLIGNSMGATLAFMYAGQHPERVERLVLLDTGPGPKPGSAPPPGARPPGPVPIPPGPFASRSAASAAAAAAVPPFMSAAFAREMSEHNLRQTADGNWDWKFDAPNVAAGAARSITDERKWPLWEAVRCPTLVLRGELSPAFPAQAAEQMVAGRNNVQLRVIPGAGHFISLDAPQALEREITGWLSM